MNAYTDLQAPPKRKLIGLVGVVVLHALLFWAIQAGLARTVIQKMPTVVQALLLEEKRPETPPLPPLPPAPPVPPTPPKTTPLPPPIVQPTDLPAPIAASKLIADTPSAAPQKLTSPAESSTLTPSVLQSQQNKPSIKTKPVAIYCEKPEYPVGSKRMEEEGIVNLQVHVGTDGNVSKITTIKSSGYKRLDEAARNEVLRWRFKPATLDGNPVDDSFTRSFKFSLDSDQNPTSPVESKSPC